MHYAAVEKLGSKWSTLATYFSKDFHTKSAKFLTELSEDPNNKKKRKKVDNQGEKKHKKSKKPFAGVCKEKCWCQKNCIDKCKNYCFEHIFSIDQQVAKKWAKNLLLVFAKKKVGVKKIVLINAKIFVLNTYLANTSK